MKDPFKSRVVASCDACTHAYTRTDLRQVEVAMVEGVEVIRCVDPVTCRRRGELIGVWGQ